MKSAWFTFLLAVCPLLLPGGVRIRADDAATGPSAKTPLPGQIVIDLEHPQWLKRHGGEHVYICGPGDPEGFLYLGRLRPDGTRDGDQVELINKLIEHGGNCMYLQIVRSHGGDARGDGDPDWRKQNPFIDGDPSKGINERIFEQWDEWFALMDEHEILIYLFIYDDSVRLWDTGDEVGPEERAFVETIVKRYQHLKNLIWVVAEESEERYSTARVQALAEVIRAADAHGHLIGDHHHSGTTFKAFQPGGDLNHFAMQLRETGDGAHQGAIEALQKADGRYQIIYSESTATPTDPDGMRKHAWAVAMGGLMPMIYTMDIVNTPAGSLRQCRTLQAFFEASDFYTMSPHDELKHGETKHVLADPGRSYIAYGDSVNTVLGVKGLEAGDYEITWLDCISGERRSMAQKIAKAGDVPFKKPEGFGRECAAWIRR
jgi:hypothetical protein